MSLLQNICDAIWDAETRTLLEGTPLADPANLLEEICDACWTETTRTLSLTLPDYPDVENESPFEQDESIVTVAATGGSAPVSYSIEAQSTTAGMLKVTGTLNPDVTGIYVENGTYRGEPAYERADGAYWIWTQSSRGYLSDTKGDSSEDYFWRSTPLTYPDGTYLPLADAEGTATVANYEPFQINASTGEITIVDASGLAAGQTWTITVQVTDALLDTDDCTVTVTLVAPTPTVLQTHIFGHNTTRRYNTTPILGILASRRT
jgi:hypothetical protein